MKKLYSTILKLRPWLQASRLVLKDVYLKPVREIWEYAFTTTGTKFIDDILDGIYLIFCRQSPFTVFSVVCISFISGFLVENEPTVTIVLVIFIFSSIACGFCMGCADSDNKFRYHGFFDPPTEYRQIMSDNPGLYFVPSSQQPVVVHSNGQRNDVQHDLSFPTGQG